MQPLSTPVGCGVVVAVAQMELFGAVIDDPDMVHTEEGQLKLAAIAACHAHDNADEFEPLYKSGVRMHFAR